MASNLSSTERAVKPGFGLLRRWRLLLSLALLALLVVCVVFFWVSRDAMAHLPSAAHPNGGGPSGVRNPIVNLQAWQTAQALAPLAVTAEETELAREAERLADHEVDQAFASALRQASAQRHVLTGEALKLSQKVEQIGQLVRDDQAHVKALTKSTGRAASPDGQAAVSAITADDLDVAQAQLGLDSDELTDAQNDLARAIGDERNRIQQELAAHEASMRKYDAMASKENPVAVVSAQRYGTVATLLGAWLGQTSRDQLIQQAMREAATDVAALTSQHNRLEAEANTAPASAADNSAKVVSLHRRATQQQLLSIFDDRIQTEQQLVSVYGKWSAQVQLQHRIVLHLLLRSFALIALVFLCVSLLDALVVKLMKHLAVNRRGTHLLRTLVQLGLLALGVVVTLLIVFGAPREMPTIIGLTTAGITVVLQDFILAFVGWFVLMGKNGIRVGDSVEINGVGGEVVETGLIRTVLLETGNWTDKGHPTGRRVSLMNGFAVKGQYFNFSTTGQWMWDEITVTIPTGEHTYPLIERIHQTVLQATEKDALLAAEEWKRLTRRSGSGPFNAAASVDLRPGLYGIDVVVRYVTRASVRFEMRNRLYQSVIDLLHSSVGSQSNFQQLQPGSSPE